MKLKKFNEMIENSDPTGLNPDGTYANPNGKTLAEKYGDGPVVEIRKNV